LEGLSVRSLNVCISENITTLKELLEFQKNNRRNFAMIRNCGRMSDKELVGICEKYRNYNFPQDEPLS
jgi:DNA-directed RNA polymerase alpha subunit